MKRILLLVLLLTLPALAAPGSRYVDSRRGFSIVPEADWVVSHVPRERGVQLEVAAPFEDNGVRGHLQVSVEPAAGLDLAEFRQRRQASMDAEGRKFVMHVDVDLGGFPGGRFLTKLTRQGVACMAETTYVLADGEAYVIEGVAPEESFSFYWEVFERMADSFVLVEKEG